MLEVTSCSTMREAEDPRVDCASLQALKTLLHNSVLKDRHPIAGGADANPHESNPTCTTGVVSPSVAGDPLAQVAAGNPTASGDVAVEVASTNTDKSRIAPPWRRRAAMSDKIKPYHLERKVLPPSTVGDLIVTPVSARI
jgi:hypothetical protein